MLAKLTAYVCASMLQLSTFERADEPLHRPEIVAFIDNDGRIVHVLPERNVVPSTPKAPPTLPPSIRVGDVRTTNGVVPRIVKRVVERELLGPLTCYEVALRTDELDHLTIELRFGIDESGVVAFLDASARAPSSLLRCAERTQSGLTFPRLDAPFGVAEMTLVLERRQT